MLVRLLRLGRLILWSAFAFATIPAPAQEFPSRQIRWVISYGPGGGSDFLARTAGAQLAKQIGQPVVIDNRPGGGGVIAAEIVARAPADGYTIFTADAGTLVYNPALFRKLPYDPVTDFAPVGMMARFHLVLIANNDSGLTSGSQAINELRQRPADFSYASPGSGSPMHLAMELLKERAKLSATHVPYRGSSPAVQDLMGGQVQLMVADSAVALPLLRAGRVKAMAVFSGSRMSALPDVPTIAELGIPGIEAYAWLGLAVPAKTPNDVVARLSAEMKRALNSDDVAPKLKELGVEVVPGDPDAMKKYLASEARLWQPLIREKGISLD